MVWKVSSSGRRYNTYKAAFEDWDFGLASTIGTVWLALVMAFAMLYVRLALRRVVQ